MDYRGQITTKHESKQPSPAIIDKKQNKKNDSGWQGWDTHTNKKHKKVQKHTRLGYKTAR